MPAIRPGRLELPLTHQEGEGCDREGVIEHVVREDRRQPQEAHQLPPRLLDGGIDDREGGPGGEEVGLDGRPEQVSMGGMSQE